MEGLALLFEFPWRVHGCAGRGADLIVSVRINRSVSRYRRPFLSSGQAGTAYSDILACMDWCFSQDRAVTGGRNFSVVHDAWKDEAGFAAGLAREADKYKLRRSGN